MTKIFAKNLLIKIVYKKILNILIDNLKKLKKNISILK